MCIRDSGITAQFNELVETVVAQSEVNFIVNDPETGKRVVRTRETNLGDFCADAYRTLLGADIAFVNGGGAVSYTHLDVYKRQEQSRA